MFSNDTTLPSISETDIDRYVKFTSWFVEKYKEDMSIKYVEQVNNPERYWRGTDKQLLDQSIKVYDKLKTKYPDLMV
jgi:hypothetical protein